jgi:hypothetical protein
MLDYTFYMELIMKHFSKIYTPVLNKYNAQPNGGFKTMGL